MRLIDADRLLTDRAKGTYYHLPNGDTAIPIIDIEHAPTVDAVQAVRCGECVHYIKHDKRCGIWNHGGIVPDDFCSRGERRTDE